MAEPERIYIRKVQKVGYSTFVVSLPKEWAKRWGLSKGSKVILRELSDGSLNITPEEGIKPIPEKLEGRLKLSADASEAELEMSVIALYEAGYDSITVTAPPSLLESLGKVRFRLSGVEVVEESEKRATLEIVLDHTELSFHRILSRMVALLRSSLKDLINYSRGGGPRLLKKVIERDDELDKFYFLLVRQASLCFRKPSLVEQLGLADQGEIVPLLYYGKTLERMGDTLAQLAMYALKRECSFPFKLANLIKNAFEYAVLSFDTGDEKYARKLSRIYYGFFSRRAGRELLEEPILYLSGNFLSLCVDVIEARVELDAIRLALSMARKPINRDEEEVRGG